MKRKLIELIKKSMVDAGRDDFVTFLAEILHISPPAASMKLKGKTQFSIVDIDMLDAKFHFDREELAEAIVETATDCEED